MLPICPVCDLTPDHTRYGRHAIAYGKNPLVSHHDHFADWASTLILRAGYQWQDHASILDPDAWSTFDPVLICAPCNSIDATLKNRHPQLPGWVSFSYEELRALRIAPQTIPSVWRTRRDRFIRPKLRLPRTFTGEDAIRSAWMTAYPQ